MGERILLDNGQFVNPKSVNKDDFNLSDKYKAKYDAQVEDNKRQRGQIAALQAALSSTEKELSNLKDVLASKVSEINELKKSASKGHEDVKPISNIVSSKK